MTFELPWYIFVGLGLFLGGILFSAKFRSESDGFLAHLIGLRPKQNKRRRR